MKEITIHTQAEFDALPENFSEYTVIKIESDKGLWLIIKKAWGNSSVEAWGNSSVEAWENSSVVARENSSVEAWGNSFVVARGNSSVEARENSSVVARENSSVVAWGNSSVVAWGNSSVVARGNSSVVAVQNSVVRVFSQDVKIKKLLHEATLICQGVKIKPDKRSITANIINTKEILNDIDTFLEIYQLEPKQGKVQLYKITRDNYKDYRTNMTEYKIGETIVCPDWDDDKDRECGGGLHLSATIKDAEQYNKGKILLCEVSVKDIVVYPYDITKVRCKKVKVLREIIK